MPRKQREKSSTGIYHVMLRSINGEVIFKENEDFEKLIQTIGEYKEVSQYMIYAYCLMNNHIHLLIKEGIEDLGIVFRRIGASYVYWYNSKYKRRGHLFQDRYKSEAVEDDRYLLTVLRYIHRNPIKAGVARHVEEYPWSSYNEYLGKNGMCDTEFVLSYFSVEERTGITLFEEFNKQKNTDECLDYHEEVRIDDEEAKDIIIKVAGVLDTAQIQHFEIGKRDKIIRELKNRGLSIRQIERLTGVSFALVRRI